MLGKLYTKPGFWGILGVSIVALIGNLLTRNLTLLRIFYLGCLVIIISLVWTLFLVSGIKLKRTVRGMKQQLGQVLEERYELTNQSRFTKLWLQVDDESNLPQSNGSRAMSQLRAKETRTYTSYTLLSRRGLYNLGPTTVSSGDFFGIFGKRVHFIASQRLLVLPYMVNLVKFPFPPGYLSGGKVLWRKTQEVTPHAAGIREYAPGDSLSRIHWPMTARKDKFMVKEFDQDPQADIWIILDGEKLAHSSEVQPPQLKRVDRLWIIGHKFQANLPPDTFEYSISAAASIANYFLKRGEQVGLCCTGQITTTLPAEKGERQLGKILEALAFIRNESQLPLLGLVDAVINQIARGCTVILISTTRSDSLAVSAQRFIRKNTHPVVVLADNETFGGAVGKKEEIQKLDDYFIPVITIRKGDDLQARLETL